MTAKRRIDRSDILDPTIYAQVRKSVRATMIEVKQKRRMAVGPNATLHFECYDTMHYQIQEMLHAERGGEAQIEDELRAYAPLIPQGNELVATFMLEFTDPVIRARQQARLGGIEDMIGLEMDGETIPADPEREVERTTAEGKTSSIHFLHFRLSPVQAERFRQPGERVTIAITHPDYGHMAVMSEETRQELAKDL